MAAIMVNDLKYIRRVLGLNQTELAQLLNISLRAVQSYEQGWRPTPIHVQQLNGLLLYMNWRKSGGKATPCWRIRKCTRGERAVCAVSRVGAEEICWLIGGAKCDENGAANGNRLARCAKCPVMRAWLPCAAPVKG